MHTGNIKEKYINMWTRIERRNGRGKGIGEEIALPIYNDDDGDDDSLPNRYPRLVLMEVHLSGL